MFTSITRRNRLVCFLAGLATPFAFAPYYAWPILFITIPVFFVYLDASTKRRGAASRAFMFGYGYFISGIWWVANALLVDVAKFGWMIPFCIFGLSAVLAVYFAVLGAVYHTLKTSSAVLNLICFIAVWVAIEYLRSIGILGFPWNLIGYASLASLNVAQFASLVGVFGLSIIVMLIAVLPALTYLSKNSKTKAAGIILPLLLILAGYGFGASRIPKETAYTDTKLRIVQPSIPQEIKGRQEAATLSVERLQKLSQGTPVDITVWPETAYPFPIRGDHIPAMPWPSRYTLTGALRIEGGRESIRLYNSIVAVDPAGLLLMAYDKHQLVPFGEFVPLRSVLPLDKITPGNLDFTRGSGAQTIFLRDLPSFSPLVCYEVIFPWMATDPQHRPDWLVNTTNDGWYRDSPGPYQHLAAAQMRAIEQGLPLIRAANNGVSAVIDPYGRITEKLPYNAEGVLNARLPEKILPTWYAYLGGRTGNLFINNYFVILRACKNS